MKDLTSIIILALGSIETAAPSTLAGRQNDLPCLQNSGGPNGDARKAVMDLLKTKLPLDVGGESGWANDGPTFRASCQGAQIWVKHEGWEGADRSLTAEDLDKTMDTFPDGWNDCSAAVDGSGSWLGILFATEGTFSGDVDYDYTC